MKEKAKKAMIWTAVIASVLMVAFTGATILSAPNVAAVEEEIPVTLPDASSRVRISTQSIASNATVTMASVATIEGVEGLEGREITPIIRVMCSTH